MPWQPTASIQALKARAQIIDEIRAFFKVREVLEVQTPLLGKTTATDPHIDSFSVGDYFLQTSPEFAMKRLLAAGSGAIFEISKAFRQEESGRYHHPEFTMLEWYRPDYTHHDLMSEVDALIQTILKTPPAEKTTYQALFIKHLSLDPLHLSTEEQASLDLDQLFSLNIMEKIGHEAPVFVYDYPKEQAALAKIRETEPPVAERFELFYQGIELANGYHELIDPVEQKQRFINDNQQRAKMGKKTLPIDNHLIAAQQHGLPECSGVALGVDRLIMIALQADHIAKTLSFYT